MSRGTLFNRVVERLRTIAGHYRTLRAQASGTFIGSRCQLGPRCDVLQGTVSKRRGLIKIDDDCVLDVGVVCHPHGGSIHLSHHVFVGPYTVIYGHGGVQIGDDTLISMHCRILSSNHIVSPLGEHIRWQPDALLPTRIGRDVWLGAGVTVLGGVNIGDGCVVGAGAVVTRDLPAGAIAYGVPAKITGFRDPAKS